MNWNNPAPGIFAIVAKAYDDLGFASTSAAAYIQVLPTSRKPAVVLMTPNNGTSVAAGASIALSAVALAPDGAIARVDYRADGQQIGSSATPPYSATWSAAMAGTPALTATAFVLQGISTTSAPIALTVTGAPTLNVALAAPANGTTFVAPATIGLSATASETGGSVAKVEFVANGGVIGTVLTPPYVLSWAGVASGTYVLAARATDVRGAVANSLPVNITVSPSSPQNQPPVITLTAPSGGRGLQRRSTRNTCSQRGRSRRHDRTSRVPRRRKRGCDVDVHTVQRDLECGRLPGSTRLLRGQRTMQVRRRHRRW